MPYYPGIGTEPLAAATAAALANNDARNNSTNDRGLQITLQRRQLAAEAARQMAELGFRNNELLQHSNDAYAQRQAAADQFRQELGYKQNQAGAEQDYRDRALKQAMGISTAEMNQKGQEQHAHAIAAGYAAKINPLRQQLEEAQKAGAVDIASDLEKQIADHESNQANELNSLWSGASIGTGNSSPRSSIGASTPITGGYGGFPGTGRDTPDSAPPPYMGSDNSIAKLMLPKTAAGSNPYQVDDFSQVPASTVQAAPMDDVEHQVNYDPSGAWKSFNAGGQMIGQSQQEQPRPEIMPATGTDDAKGWMDVAGPALTPATAQTPVIPDQTGRTAVSALSTPPAAGAAPIAVNAGSANGQAAPKFDPLGLNDQAAPPAPNVFDPLGGNMLPPRPPDAPAGASPAVRLATKNAQSQWQKLAQAQQQKAAAEQEKKASQTASFQEAQAKAAKLEDNKTNDTGYNQDVDFLKHQLDDLKPYQNTPGYAEAVKAKEAQMKAVQMARDAQTRHGDFSKTANFDQSETLSKLAGSAKEQKQRDDIDTKLSAASRAPLPHDATVAQINKVFGEGSDEAKARIASLPNNVELSSIQNEVEAAPTALDKVQTIQAKIAQLRGMPEHFKDNPLVARQLTEFGDPMNQSTSTHESFGVNLSNAGLSAGGSESKGTITPAAGKLYKDWARQQNANLENARGQPAVVARELNKQLEQLQKSDEFKKQLAAYKARQASAPAPGPSMLSKAAGMVFDPLGLIPSAISPFPATPISNWLGTKPNTQS